MGTYRINTIIAVVGTVALLPVAMLPILGRVTRRYGALRGWPLVAGIGLLGSAVALAAFTVFPLPDPGTLECSGGTLSAYWQTEWFGSIALDRARARDSRSRPGAVTRRHPGPGDPGVRQANAHRHRDWRGDRARPAIGYHVLLAAHRVALSYESAAAESSAAAHPPAGGASRPTVSSPLPSRGA